MVNIDEGADSVSDVVYDVSNPHSAHAIVETKISRLGRLGDLFTRRTLPRFQLRIDGVATALALQLRPSEPKCSRVRHD